MLGAGLVLGAGGSIDPRTLVGILFVLINELHN